MCPFQKEGVDSLRWVADQPLDLDPNRLAATVEPEAMHRDELLAELGEA